MRSPFQESLGRPSVIAFIREGNAGRWQNAAQIIDKSVEAAKTLHMAIAMMRVYSGEMEMTYPLPAPKPEPEVVVPEGLLKKACRIAGISIDDAQGGKRTRDYTYRRFHVMYLLRSWGRSFPQIGAILNRDHTTVLAGVRKHEWLIEHGKAPAVEAAE